MINATNSIPKRELIPAGNYISRCFSMIHIGTVKEDILGKTKLLNKIRITWELPTETVVYDEAKGKQPIIISKEYTLSMNEKANLRRDLESWRGRSFTEKQAESFDVSRLLGVPCMLNIIHKVAKNGNEIAIISSISALPKGFDCPDQVNENFEFNYEDKWDEFALENFPDFIKVKIKSSEEYRKIKSPITDLTDDLHDVPVNNDDDNDLPF